MTLTAGLYLIEGDKVNFTLDIAEGSYQRLVLGTGDSQGCEDIINRYFDEVRHASKIDDLVQDCSISIALGMEINWDIAVLH